MGKYASYKKEWAKRNPDKIREYRFKENSKLETRMVSRCKHRAKKYNLLFDLSPDDITIPTHCPVLGIKIIPKIMSGGKRGYSPDSPSLDRIKPGLGYVKGNVRVISARANLLKNDATIEELEKVLEDLKCLS